MRSLDNQMKMKFIFGSQEYSNSWLFFISIFRAGKKKKKLKVEMEENVQNLERIQSRPPFVHSFRFILLPRGHCHLPDFHFNNFLFVLSTYHNYLLFGRLSTEHKRCLKNMLWELINIYFVSTKYRTCPNIED